MIYVYGDSYANCGLKEYQWPCFLESMIGEEVINKGIPGSALNYSISKLLCDLNQNIFGPNDSIVFIMTSNDRVYVPDMPNPGLGVASAADVNWTLNKPLPEIHWIEKNMSNLVWVRENVYASIINYELLRTLSLIKLLSIKMPSLKFIVYQAFAGSDSESPLLGLIDNSENFIYVNNLVLFRVSENEITTIKNTAQIDYRHNHFCRENRVRLARLTKQIIETMLAPNISYSYFVQDVFKDYDDMRQQCALGDF